MFRTYKVSILINNITLPAGTERAVVNLANNLSQHGCDVEIVSLYTEDGESYYDTSPEVTVTHLGYQMRDSLILRTLHLVGRVLSLVRERGERVFLGTGHSTNIALAVARRLRRSIRCVACEHMGYAAAPAKVQSIRNVVYGWLDAVVVLTDQDKTTYSSKVKLKKCVVIPNQLPFYPAEPSMCENHKLLSVGRYTEQKGFDILIDDAMDVLKRHPGWRLDIIGGGEMQSLLKEKIKKFGMEQQIFLKPFTKDITDLYLNASIYLMTSRWEGFPMVLLEAKACGLPVVAYDCPSGPSEIVEKEDGFLVRMRHTAEFADSLEILMTNKELRKTMGEAARKNALSFSPQKTFLLWDDLLVSL